MKKYWKVILIVLVAVVAIVLKLLDKDGNEVINSSTSDKELIKENSDIVVEIRGEVNKPGLFMVKSGARINDVIILANGLTPNADITNINLAEKVSDGMTILIPKYNKEVITNDEGKVSVNYGTYQELISVPNLGQATANKIIAYREKYGFFHSLEDIKKAGIDNGRFEKIKEYLCL